ncbi:unnamed protein product [Echinostoma caproni]|uniref:KRAB domain-containing protein n=1 Tax=Echinostoma caproni TaxID=27848 RepID=A0A183AZ56_9TREM|nr:unnamed protein product [Echinostoma caproni]
MTAVDYRRITLESQQEVEEVFQGREKWDLLQHLRPAISSCLQSARYSTVIAIRLVIMHESSTINHEDYSTWGLKADDQNWERWFRGPPSLRSLEEMSPLELVTTEEIEGQIELKLTVNINQTTVAMSVN